jgi:hypothetical protein
VYVAAAPAWYVLNETAGVVRALATAIRPIPANEVASNETIIKRTPYVLPIMNLLDTQT